MIIAIILGVILLYVIFLTIRERIKVGKWEFCEMQYMLLLVSIFFVISVILPVAIVNIGGYYDYNNLQYERQCIIAEYSSSNANSQFFVYERAKDFNLRLMREKRTVKNKWINIYGSRKVASIEYIEFYGLSAPNE